MKRILSSTFFIFALTLFFSNLTFAEEDDNILSGVPIQGNMSSKEELDVYQFTTNKDNGEVYITLDNATGTFYMTLYNVNGERLNYDYASRGDNAVISQKLAKGTYYIKITPYSWFTITSATYRLKATYASSITRNNSTFEPNDTIETSLSIKSGQFYKSDSHINVDRDVYQFTTNKDNGEVYITLDNATGTFYMTLYNVNGERLNYDYASSGDDAVISQKLAKGTYYIKITPYSWSTITSATYRLKATYASSITRNNSTFEPNDTIEASMKMISNKSYKSSSYSAIDRDVYQFTTNKDNGEVYITLDNATGTFYMTLYNVNGEQLNYDYASRGDNAVISQKLAKGTYYIKITPYSWSTITSATYRLKATFIDKTPSVNPVYDDSTVITGKAVPKTKVYAWVGSKKLGEATASNGKYSIKIFKQKAGTAISVYTVDSAGNRSANKTVKVLDKTATKTLTVSKVTNKTTYVTGKTEAKASVEVKLGSKLLGKATADSKGNYKVKIKVQKKGSKLTVVARDQAKNAKTVTTTVK